MTAYYNEHEPNAAAWLRELIKEGHIAPGDVDERSIVDVRADELAGYTQVHFFAGIGGWSLALRRAGWSDDNPVWTGSCPCQPFSAAGRRKGFDDDRHLWPVFRALIAERRPAAIFGEQVASASDWLRLVRGDLEALEYAVGAMPIEAASAGADHLRDRFWFVAHAALSAGERQRQHGRALLPNEETERLGGAGHVGNAGCEGLAVGSIAEIERGNVRHEGAAAPSAGPGGVAVANANEPKRRQRDEQPAWQQPEPQQDARACDGGDLSDAERQRLRGARPGTAAGATAGMQGADGQREWLRSDAGAVCDFEWAIGADGKARRVKSGVRLLVDGFPCRVGLLRGFGNAIDPRPAAAFIEAAASLINA